jgi:hypothetical protein
MMTNDKEAAYRKWMIGGSASLGLWLVRHSWQAGRKHGFTTAEYGEWVQVVKALEMERTGQHAEFCSAQAERNKDVVVREIPKETEPAPQDQALVSAMSWLKGTHPALYESQRSHIDDLTWWEYRVPDGIRPEKAIEAVRVREGLSNAH